MSTEYSITQIEAIRLQQQVDALIARDQQAYRDREWLMQPSKRHPEPKPERDPRGSKKGVKRGHYKKHDNQPPAGA